MHRPYAEFWPFYLREHARPATRTIRHAGTIASAVLPIWVLATQSWWWPLAVPVCGYGPTWFVHFFVERNKPATFQATLRSLIGDYRMCGLWLCGRRGSDLMEYQIRA